MDQPCNPVHDSTAAPATLDGESGCANVEATPITTVVLLLCCASFLVYLLRSEAVRTFLDECQRLLPKLVG